MQAKPKIYMLGKSGKTYNLGTIETSRTNLKSGKTWADKQEHVNVGAPLQVPCELHSFGHVVVVWAMHGDKMVMVKRITRTKGNVILAWLRALIAILKKKYYVMIQDASNLALATRS